MNSSRIRVLYSFPHKLGGARLSDGAWQQVNALAAAGADVLAFPGVLHRPVPASVTVRTTLARGKFRIPYKVLGKMRALALHDHIVARRLEKLAGKVDVVHAFAAGALETLKTARKLGIPTVLERTNAHTRYAFEVVRKEFDRLGIVLPPEDEYFYRDDLLAKEEAEYEAADYILCPSDFVVKTFLDYGFARSKLLRYFNGVDTEAFRPAERRETPQVFTMLFVGVAAVRKGVHFALEAWLQSEAAKSGQFLIVGDFLPAYKDKLAPMLAHPSVKVLGRVSDVPEVMRTSDILALPSIEEGFGRVVTEAMASGCVPLASDACTDYCRHMETGLVHKVADVEILKQHIDLLYRDRSLLNRLRTAALELAPTLTWTAVGVKLVDIYRSIVNARQRQSLAHQAAAANTVTVDKHNLVNAIRDSVTIG